MEIANGTQRLRRYVASLSLVTLITSLFAVNVAQGATYSDVQPSDWFYTYVEQLVSGGVLDKTMKTYRPGDNANRAEAAKMLVEAASLTIDTSAGPSFKDVAKTAWYYKYVETAAKNGVLGGYKDASGKLTGKFGPSDSVTREQFSKMAYNALALKKSTDGGPHFSDVPADRWSYEFVESLYNWSVIDGYADKTFKPERNINRAEIAKMVVGAQNPVKRAVAFKVSSAASKSSTSVEVTFSDDVDATTGAAAANYSVKESGGTTVLAVSAAAVNGKMVTLTTAAQMEGKKYTVTASGVKSKAGKALDSAAASADFMVTVSTFKVSSAKAMSSTMAEVVFSMDVDATEAVKAANYSVKDAAGAVLAVSAAALATGKTNTVTLTTAAQTVDKEYTLTVSNLKSKDGKALAVADVTAKFKGYNPVMATAKSATSVEVTFSDDVDTVTGAVVANYVITPALAVSAAVVKDKMVTLTTASQTASMAYTLAVKGVKSKVTAPAVAKNLDGSAAFTGFSTTPVATGAPLTVASASETPAAKTLATKTANNTLLVLDLTASGGEAQVSGVKVWKTGLYNDSSVKVVAFDATGERISSGVTFSDGMAEVGFLKPLKVGATATKVWLNVSITGTANGDLGIRVKDAASITSNSSKVSGSFPIDSVVNRVVDGTPSVAAATLDSVTISGTTRSIDIGEVDYEVTKFKLAETSSKEDLKVKSWIIFNNGSAADGDLKNFKLVDQSGNTLATVADQKNKLIKFDLSKSPYLLTKGSSRNFSVKATIVNGATRTAQLLVQNDFDIDAVGVTTGASILPIADSGGIDSSFPIGDNSTAYNNLSINEGTLTVSKANNSPSGDVTIGATDTVLGSFELKAAGEDIELQRLRIALASTDVASINIQDGSGNMECNDTFCDLSGSIQVKIDEKQDGTSLRTILSTSAFPGATLAGNLWGAAGSLANLDLSSFYTIPAGKAVNLLIVGNVTSTAYSATGPVGGTDTGERITVGIRDVYHYKKSSLKYATQPLPASTVRANALTVNRSSLTVSKNTAYGDQTIVAQSKVKLGSFVVSTGSAEGVDITSINITGGLNSGATTVVTGYTNMYLLRNSNSAQLGTTKGTITLDNTASNTYSFSGFALAAGSSEIIDLYADVASSAGTAAVSFKVAASGVSGTGKTSSTTVSGPAAALTLQVITATASGNLTVSVAGQTPVSQTLTGGSVNKQVLILQLSASNAEDLYIKKLRFRGLRTADDRAIGSASLLFGTDPAALTQVGSTLPWQLDGANPGFSEFTFSGSTRPKIVKNGTSYAALAVNLVPSNQDLTISGKQPQFVLNNLEAEGLTTLAATSTTQVTGTTDLKINSGIILAAGGAATANSTFASSTKTLSAAVTSATATSLVLTTGSVFHPGDIIFIDQNDGTASGGADTKWTSATEELMLVLADNGTALTVERGAFGTTAQAAYTSGRTIFILNTGNTSVNSLVGNQFNVYHTKPTFAVASTSPAGTTSGGLIEIFRFNVTADANTAPGDWKVQLGQVDLTTTKAGQNVTNLRLYPGEPGLDSDTYRTPGPSTPPSNCFALSQTKWRCIFNTNNNSNEVKAGTTRSYFVRAEVGTTLTTPTSLQTSIASLGTLGTNLSSPATATVLTPGDVVWGDTNVNYTVSGTLAAGTLRLAAGSGSVGDGAATNGIGWVYQTTSEVRPSNPLTMSSTGGIADVTFLTTGLGIALASSGTTDDNMDAGDVIAITFPETIDPTSINASLVPGGSAVTLSLASAASGTGGVSSLNTSAVVTVTGITTFGAGASMAASGNFRANTLSLNTAGTVLTITLALGSGGTAGGTVTTAALSAGTSVASTVKDVNNNAMGANTTATPTQTGGGTAF